MQLPAEVVLTLELAKGVADTCRTYARKRGFPIDVAIVDAGGHLVYFEREDGVAPGTVRVAILKAQSSALFRSPSKAFESAVDEGLIGLVALPGMAPFEGAVPLAVAEKVIGAVAVSGVTKEIDGEIAQAGADAVVHLLEQS